MLCSLCSMCTMCWPCRLSRLRGVWAPRGVCGDSRHCLVTDRLGCSSRSQLVVNRCSRATGGACAAADSQSAGYRLESCAAHQKREDDHQANGLLVVFCVSDQLIFPLRDQLTPRAKPLQSAAGGPHPVARVHQSRHSRTSPRTRELVAREAVQRERMRASSRARQG